MKIKKEKALRAAETAIMNVMHRRAFHLNTKIDESVRWHDILFFLKTITNTEAMNRIIKKSESSMRIPGWDLVGWGTLGQAKDIKNLCEISECIHLDLDRDDALFVSEWYDG